MDPKTKYRTKQRDILLNYLKNAPRAHITAGDVCEHFKSCGAPIGQATVYRQLESMVDEGLINKYTIDSASPACFEFVGVDAHVHAEVCFHCKCEKCGKLIHLHCEELEGIQAHLMEHHRFRLNPMRTVFYGVCDECMSALEEMTAPKRNKEETAHD